MNCREITHRQKLQDQLLEMNPGAGEAIQRMVTIPHPNLFLMTSAGNATFQQLFC